MDDWLGKPTWKQNQGRFTLNYRFEISVKPIISRKVKIEINTRGVPISILNITKAFNVESGWFKGQAQVLTYSLEELLGTKLRALYQRKKGRDLYDFWYAINYFKNFDKISRLNAFQYYMQLDSKQISRAEFEKNLFIKQSDKVFSNDILPLLSTKYANRYQGKLINKSCKILLSKWPVNRGKELLRNYFYQLS